MWKYWGTKDNVFWDAGTIDKPSREYINNMIWEQLDINLNITENRLIQIMLNNKEYGLLRAQNDETGVNVYYMLKSVLKHVQNGFLLEYELDTWTSYTLPLTEKDINVLVDRHQDYDDNRCLDFNEDTNIDVSQDGFKIHKNYFKKSWQLNGYAYSYNDNGDFIKYDAISPINQMYCLVLNKDLDLTNTGRVFIPLLSKSGICKFFRRDDFIDIEKFDVGNDLDLTNVTIPNSINHWVDSLNRRKQWVYQVVLEINNEKYIIFPEDIKRLSYIEFMRYIDDSIDFRTGDGVYRLSPFDKQDLRANIYVLAVEQPKHFKADCLNSYNKIIELSKTKFANIIEGLYIIPNILNLADLWRLGTVGTESMMILEHNISGNKINTPLLLYKNVFIDDVLKFNNENIQFRYLLKFYDANYLNNLIDISKYLNNKNIEINYSLMFTNCFNLITNNNKFQLENRVIELPSKQSFPISEYANYVQANMNTVNTGYEIQKQQAVVGGLSGVFGGVLSGVIGSALGGNVLGAISGAGGAISSVSSSIIGVKNYEKQIRAKYADAKNSMSDKVLFGATRDVIWNDLINENKNSYDLFMYRDLSVDSIKQLNNYFLLNGVYNPKYFKLNNLPNSTKHLGFIYAKLNSTNFNQIFSKHINTTRVTKDIILNELQEFRIWDKTPSIE